MAQYIVNGLTSGMVYALVAVGYSLVFGILRLINMAHGSIYAFAAHMMLMAITWNWGVVPGVLCSIVLTTMLVLIYDRGILAPLRKKKDSGGVPALISTIGFSYVISNMLTNLFGSETKAFPQYLGSKMIYLMGVRFQSGQIYIVLTSGILLIVFSLIIFRTKIGLAMRAVQQNSRAADLMAIDTKGVITFTFFLSSLSAVIAAFLIASYYQMVYPSMGSLMGMKAFCASVLGGIGSLYGAVIGGLILGLVENLTVRFLSGAYKDAVCYVILFIVLVIRPTGLFGKKNVSKL